MLLGIIAIKGHFLNVWSCIRVLFMESTHLLFFGGRGGCSFWFGASFL